MKDWFFHVRHNAKPANVKEVLEILNGRTIDSVEALIEAGKDLGFVIGTTVTSAQSVKENPIQTARDLGLIESTCLVLTPLGNELVRLMTLKPRIVNDLFHFLNHSKWASEHPSQNCFSWTYRNACDLLWQRNSMTIDRADLADQLVDLARSQFSVHDVALSNNSIVGILGWLRDLDPSVISESSTDKKAGLVFTRRMFCPPELFALAVDDFYRRNEVAYQTNLLMDDDKRETICKTCLLDPDAFDHVLDWTCGQFGFVRQGTTGGWGRYLVLSRAPTLDDFTG